MGTMLLFNEDMNETAMFHLFPHMQQAEETGDGTELAEEANATTPVVTNEWDMPEQPLALHYLCKAVFDRDHRFLHRACWRAGDAQATALLIDEDMNSTNLLQVISQHQETEYVRNSSASANESDV